MKLKFMQLGKNLETKEDNEKDTWELISKDFDEESKELLEAIKEGNMLHIAEETFDVIQIAIRSLVLLKKNNINLETENKQHNRKLKKRKWEFVNYIEVKWGKQEGSKIKVKEFNSNGFLDEQINTWFEENQNVKIIDTKYSADENSSNALIIYGVGD